MEIGPAATGRQPAYLTVILLGDCSTPKLRNTGSLRLAGCAVRVPSGTNTFATRERASLGEVIPSVQPICVLKDESRYRETLFWIEVATVLIDRGWERSGCPLPFFRTNLIRLFRYGTVIPGSFLSF